jgi:hypothetical protein
MRLWFQTPELKKRKKEKKLEILVLKGIISEMKNSLEGLSVEQEE